MNILGLGIICVWIAGVVGWFMNVFALITAVTGAASMAALSPFVIMRAIGVIIAPLGSILGLFF